ncbi:MAG: methionyl-tRNA formyltransferase [Firmicutes bacterium]|nr:methionyl-tRNA formyltransferase [Bacillota bacterium]
MRIVFMGTPEIGAVCLQRLIDDGFEIVGVYTQPDRPKGRGMKTAFSPVKQTALAHGLPVFQPENFREPETVEALRALQPDVAAVVAYGRILPQRVLDIPPKGCINIHASILPQYRGAAPYQWAVLDGREETGVTAMYLTAEMDAGDIIEISRTPIHPDETAGQLLERLAQLGAALLSRTMARLAQGEVAASPQDPSGVSYAPMLDKTLCPIDWKKPARQIHNQVRGLNPWPVATATLAGTHFKIYSTAVVSGEGAPGTILGLTRTGLRVACGQGAVEIRTLQAEGGKRMAAPDYFRGHPLEG